jgi:cell wall-associated NlpC family hydrolase
MSVRPVAHRYARATALFGSLLLASLTGCTPFRTGMPGEPLPGSSGGGPTTTSDVGQQIAATAESLLGAPYRYGGSGPDAFDCSGLVNYVHARFGVSTPRTAAQQFALARPVTRSDLQAGDLVFFRLSGSAVSHVGIYLGNGEFVHAPQTGARVRVATLDDDFFRPRFAGGGRLYGR